MLEPDYTYYYRYSHTLKFIYKTGKQLGTYNGYFVTCNPPDCDHRANDECDVDAFETIHFVTSTQLIREKQFHLLQKATETAEEMKCLEYMRKG